MGRGGFTSAVTGTRILGRQPKQSVLAAAVPLIAGLSDSAAQSRLDADLSGYNRIEQDAARKHMALQPSDDAPPRQKLAWAQQGAAIPSLRNVMEAYVKDELTEAPGRRAQAAWERTKFDADQAHKKKMEDKESYVLAQDGSVKLNTRTGVAEPTGVKPRPTAQQEKTAAERDTKLQNFDTVINMVNDAVPYLDKVNPGLVGLIKDTWTTLKAESTDATRANKALDVFAENLKPYYNRPPGDPTGKEVENWGKAMGALNDRFASVEDRKAAAATVVKIMTDQKNRLGGVPADDLRGTIERVVKERGEPTGSFVGDPTAAINAMSDPVEREMARRAYSNQQRGAKAPRELTWNPKTRRLE